MSPDEFRKHADVLTVWINRGDQWLTVDSRVVAELIRRQGAAEKRLAEVEYERDEALKEHTDMMWQRIRADERAEATERTLAEAVAAEREAIRACVYAARRPPSPLDRDEYFNEGIRAALGAIRARGSSSYITAPCVVCGANTVLACSDCAIDSGGRESVHVCDNRECRNRHEASAHNTSGGSSS